MATRLDVVDAIRAAMTASLVSPAVRDGEPSQSAIAPIAALDTGTRQSVHDLINGLAGITSTILAFRLFLPDSQVTTLSDVSLAFQRVADWIAAIPAT